MILYNTNKGVLISHENRFYLTDADWDSLAKSDDIHGECLALAQTLQPVPYGPTLLENGLLPPIGSQEVWAAGVTYFRSREARMEESRDAGGGDFYDRVYYAARPELFFKSPPYRVAGHGQQVRIRKDSKWNVPEPELALLITPGGRITGYTIGNDMSSRDIEGENPLYLPQAKSYDGATALGPGVLVSNTPPHRQSAIRLEIYRQGQRAFEGTTALAQMKRQFSELAEYLYRETTFPHGCYLLTGTGVVPPDSFTLARGDEIRISIDGIGTLINTVA
ncbi:MAG: fumarylacetoacetate hydrolase family protein [Phaeodactylibacter sp.]|nr:fumarylacetoacetate hydrolase family protein [Phaeodactylibacter sp.]MCB9277021.1 fumarylacetoacetate hydrolase family protein [Lewinellaceae bacterium]